jgi:hypothetical protein
MLQPTSGIETRIYRLFLLIRIAGNFRTRVCLRCEAT